MEPRTKITITITEEREESFTKDTRSIEVKDYDTAKKWADAFIDAVVDEGDGMYHGEGL